MNKIINCKFTLLLEIFSFVCSTQSHSQQQPLKNFEGYYQFTNDTSTYLQIPNTKRIRFFINYGTEKK